MVSQIQCPAAISRPIFRSARWPFRSESSNCLEIIRCVRCNRSHDQHCLRVRPHDTIYDNLPPRDRLFGPLDLSLLSSNPRYCVQSRLVLRRDGPYIRRRVASVSRLNRNTALVSIEERQIECDSETRGNNVGIVPGPRKPNGELGKLAENGGSELSFLAQISFFEREQIQPPFFQAIGRFLNCRSVIRSGGEVLCPKGKISRRENPTTDSEKDVLFALPVDGKPAGDPFQCRLCGGQSTIVRTPRSTPRLIRSRSSSGPRLRFWQFSVLFSRKTGYTLGSLALSELPFLPGYVEVDRGHVSLSGC